MKKYFCLFLISLSFIFTSPIFSETKNVLSVEQQQSIQNHMKLLSELKMMYEKKHFQQYLFDTKNGYLQTSLSNEDKMPLTYFIEYNNMWWFPIINKVDVPSIGYDYKSNTGFIVLNIYYGNNHILRGTQYIKFIGDKINYIRTYGSPAFFTENDPLIQLDAYGNKIWLQTGYDINYGVKAALLFFESPLGKSFVENPKTKDIVLRIQKNLMGYLKTNH